MRENHMPITRIVKLQFHPNHVGEFREIFSRHMSHMDDFPDCLELNGFQDHQHPQIFFTISRWKSQEALDQYRYSEYFRQIWGRVKPLFSAKAEAYSVVKI